MKAKVSSRGGESRLAVKKSKAERDPNKPRRPASAFFVFMEGFRRDYKEKHPHPQVAVVGKAGGEKWKSLTDAEKAPFVAKAEKLKADYTKKIDAYNKPQAGGPEAFDDSDKSKSEINEEDGGSDEKAPHIAKAEYTKKIDAYNNPQAGGQEAFGDSDKSKSEINGSEGDD